MRIDVNVTIVAKFLDHNSNDNGKEAIRLD